MDRLAPGGGHGPALVRGHAFYWRETIFAIVFGGRLYLKIDEGSKGDYLARGMG
ncbi:TfoX/Sxy family protein [Tundrisphaera sp. TA3]|uniref:TfoX/Sxy family protein n=1 Tax=Tundrisphaera sp. TA3 TaxID=3435775 RepID=UPI003EBA1B40